MYHLHTLMHMSYVYSLICLTGKGNTTIIEAHFLGSGLELDLWAVNIYAPLNLKVTKDTRLTLNNIYVWKLNQT
jgi:hypothetical protein